MTVTNIKDIDGFFREIGECKGNVYLQTDQGDKLNLKSQLTKYVALSSMFDEGLINNVDITFDESTDAIRMMKFLISGEGR